MPICPLPEKVFALKTVFFSQAAGAGKDVFNLSVKGAVGSADAWNFYKLRKLGNHNIFIFFKVFFNLFFQDNLL